MGSNGKTDCNRKSGNQNEAELLIESRFVFNFVNSVNFV